MSDESERARAEVVAAELLADLARWLAPDQYEAWRDRLALAYLRGKRDATDATIDRLGSTPVPLRDTL